ncbi:MAG TPA: imidazole glycerol phosphate synthase subunit HisH [Aquella sp.]|nr:imidazole glycerol phosphate synthase subunit HisH [Aquella sp.]
MKLVIIESGGANFLSVSTAFERLGVSYQLSNNPLVIQAADAVILPGVGSAGFSMQKLHQDGLINVIKNLKQPVLGICLGMQLLYEFSEEDNVDCLGIISGKITKFPSANNLIVPHMGWNNLQTIVDDPILSGIDSNDVYFVHSYYAPVTGATIASTEYGINFTAITKHNNFYGMQFHPEKSGQIGSQLLENFVKLCHCNDSNLSEII